MVAREAEFCASARHDYFTPWKCYSIRSRRYAAPVWAGVVNRAQRGEAVVIQAAVGDSCGPEEGPHVCIAPAQYGIYSHEGRPARAAGAEFILALCIGVSSAAAHHIVRNVCIVGDNTGRLVNCKEFGVTPAGSQKDSTYA